ncbi:hypothetical protein ACWEQK_33450 [Streptomyces parvulus]
MLERAVTKLQAGDRVHHRLDNARQGTAVKTALGLWVINWDDEGEQLTSGEDIVPLG